MDPPLSGEDLQSFIDKGANAVAEMTDYGKKFFEVIVAFSNNCLTDDGEPDLLREYRDAVLPFLKYVEEVTLARLRSNETHPDSLALGNFKCKDELQPPIFFERAFELISLFEKNSRMIRTAMSASTLLMDIVEAHGAENDVTNKLRTWSDLCAKAQKFVGNFEEVPCIPCSPMSLRVSPLQGHWFCWCSI